MTLELFKGLFGKMFGESEKGRIWFDLPTGILNMMMSLQGVILCGYFCFVQVY